MQSNEFDPGSGSRPYPNGVAVFNGQLFVVGGSGAGPGELGQTNVALNTLSDAQSLAQAKWSSTEGPSKSLPHVSGRCALVTSGANLFFFGSSNTQQPYATYATHYNETGPSGPEWVVPVTPLQDMQGRVVEFASYDVDAKAFGLTGILVGASCLSYGVEDLTYLGYYDTSDYDSATRTWKARYSVYITPAELSAIGPQGANGGLTLSLDWFAAATGNPGTGQQGQAEYYLAVHLTSSTVSLYAGNTLFFFPFTVDASGAVQSINVSPTGPTPASSWPLPLPPPQIGVGAAVARDPAGRLVVYYVPPGQSVLQTLYVNTNTFTAGQMPTSVLVTRQISECKIAPSVFYWMSPVSNNQSSAFELLFYSSNLIAQANFFGTAQILPNYTQYAPIPKAGGGQNVVQGIFDGPIPFPNVNSQNYTFEDTLYEAATVTYGTSKTTSVQHQQSFALTAGFQSAGSVTKGVGLAWNVSVNGGFNLGSGQEVGTTLADPVEKRSELDMTSKTIDPNGSMSLSQTSMAVSFFQFTDASGTVITGPNCSDSNRQSPLGFNVAVTFPGGTSGNFLPYAFTPGNLASYTPESINQTMNALGYKGNYFGEVILPNAFKFSGSQNYLQCVWSDSGFASDPSFSSFQTSFTECGWTFDSSIYAGLSGGMDTPAFAFNVTAMVGVTVSMQGSTTDTSGEEWGVALEAGWLGPPPCPNVGSGIAGYTFLIFFLPPPDGTTFPPNYWAQEMIEYGAKVEGQTFDMTSIDPNSQCWKITYVVTEYSTNDGQTRYTYNGALGQV